MTALQLDRPPLHLPPRRRRERVLLWCASAAMHLVVFAIIAATVTRNAVDGADSASVRLRSGAASVESGRVVLPRIVFRTPQTNSAGRGGGGGGGNRDRRPIRQATAPGHDAATLLTRRRGARIETDKPIVGDRLPAVVLDARSLASGDSLQAGLPLGGVSFGASLGSGSGGGAGTGRGAGIGAGQGPGIGPGSGGGSGGGRYKVGNGVTAPRLLVRTAPRYTADALERRIEGTVSLAAVVTSVGTPADIRVVRSLDRGLDEEAIRAVRQWRFRPGTLAGSPVDVEVEVLIDFWIR